MNWDKVKIILIAALCVVNIFFAVNLIQQYRNTELIDRKDIETASMLLGKSGIEVDSAIIPGRKLKAAVYGGVFDEGYYKKAVFAVSGADSYNIYMISKDMVDGVRIIPKNSNDVFEFYGEFSVEYIKNNNGEGDFASAEYVGGLKTADAAEAEKSYRRLTAAEEKKYIGKIKSIFASVSDETATFGIACVGAYEDENYGRYVVYCAQTLDGLPVSGCEAVFVYSESELLYIGGALIFTPPETEYKTKHGDVLNILFEEKKDSDGTEETKTVVSLRYIYCVSWDGQRKGFFLLPALRIAYSDGTVSVRNAINGGVYNL